jgi:hypothetical protein
MSARYYDDDPDAPQEMDVDWADAADDDEAEDDVGHCPNCGATVHVLTERCPRCGMWIDAGAMQSPAARRARGWFWPVMVAVLIAIILVFWAGL